MDEKLLSLPWELQLALGGGYLAYAAAYVGIRRHHQSADIFFRALAFGLLAWAVLALMPMNRPWFRAASAIGAAVVGGVLWRIVGIELTRRLLRASDFSWADDAPSAWATLYANHSRNRLTQASVLLEDGTWLNCTLCGDFNDAPFGPLVLGPEGDVALYVTDEEEPDGTIHRCGQVRDDEFGDRLTYIPAGRIRRIAFRFKAP